MPLRKISSCHQDLLDIIYKIADITKVREIEYDIEFGCEDIDNCHSGMFKVIIKGSKDGHKTKKVFIIKWHPTYETRLFMRKFYKREFVFYEHIVPKYLSIQRKFKIIEGLKIKFPNCIFASDEYDKETIVIVGMLEQGLKFNDRFNKLNLEHVSLLMRLLAKYHAFSFILERTNPEEFEEISKCYRKDVQYSDPDRESQNLKYLYNASVNVISDPQAKEKLKNLSPAILSVLYKCTKPVPGYSAICHGDCWNNNIIYKYKGGRPVDVLFIDYQLSRYASPVTDISYFLYMSTEKEFLIQNYEKVIDIYFGTLKAVLRQCDFRVEDIYPKFILQEHLKDYSVFGLIEALISMMIITAPSEEALKMTDMKHQFPNEGLGENEFGDKSWFVERVNGVVDDFFSRGYSLDAILNK